MDDLLDSADKEIDEWLDDLRMKPLVHKRCVFALSYLIMP